MVIIVIGIFISIIVAILWAYGEVHYTKATSDTGRKNLLFYQYLIASILYFIVVLILKPDLFFSFSVDKFILVAPIAVINMFGAYLSYLALSNGKLSIVSPIMAAYPIIDIALAVLFLKENISTYQIIASILITISIVVLSFSTDISKSTKKKRLIGIIAAITYMIIIALSTYFEKNIYVNNYSMYDIFYYSGIIYLIGSVVIYIIMIITKDKLKALNLNTFIGNGCTNLGNLLSSVALYFGNLAIVTPIMSLYTVLTNYLSRTILKERVSLRQSICICIIILSTLFIVVWRVL